MVCVLIRGPSSDEGRRRRQPTTPIHQGDERLPLEKGEAVHGDLSGGSTAMR